MIKNRLETLIEQKAKRDKRPSISLNEISHQTNVSRNTLYLWLSQDGVAIYHANTLNAFCKYFDCNVGDVLEHIPNPETPPEAPETPKSDLGVSEDQ